MRALVVATVAGMLVAAWVNVRRDREKSVLEREIVAAMLGDNPTRAIELITSRGPKLDQAWAAEMLSAAYLDGGDIERAWTALERAAHVGCPDEHVQARTMALLRAGVRLDTAAVDIAGRADTWRKFEVLARVAWSRGSATKCVEYRMRAAKLGAPESVLADLERVCILSPNSGALSQSTVDADGGSVTRCGVVDLMSPLWHSPPEYVQAVVGRASDELVGLFSALGRPVAVHMRVHRDWQDLVRQARDLGCEPVVTGAFLTRTKNERQECAFEAGVVWSDEYFARAVRHELMHAFVLSADLGTPIWLDEGLATWFEDAREVHEKCRDVRGASGVSERALETATSEDFDGPDGRALRDRSAARVVALLDAETGSAADRVTSVLRRYRSPVRNRTIKPRGG